MSILARERFESIVSKALEHLPEKVHVHMKNVVVCVEDRPTREQLQRTGTRKGEVLLGLYEGIPETEWGKGFGNHLPDKITIFQESIEHFAETPEEAELQVRATVWHEVAHYFGFPEEELRELERKHRLSS